ncbi:TIGR04283 family arsenosugar biosynthesis glycosyltransferase [Microbulbifer thermotolerans]|uniref:TIGR04283 family arsenosugar biosynthesis glycosyltransferase n=1 Tax=Microbulbifer thermotolerans TaxID=252514 RepID=UPI0026732F89|nr:TIGR04283 family arsenosugar biosynthesis glycosyltransferase [Microbulbifer thermotolerans]WKT61655.1 TIGR04283 family arsenosugar biosynthesis glycosyltransferase [Microbulbifer thermotolerans]
MRFSIVVPLLNEREQLPQLIEHLRSLLARDNCEVIFVDGGSDDGSVEFLSAAGLTVIAAQRGRARQMNAGAAAAGGDCLLFLHADTRLPENALENIERALLRGKCWGRFDVRISGNSIWFPLIATLINWRSRISGIATGDQGIFVRRDLFEELGGFADQPLMEDIALSGRLLELARPACIRARVTTSGRRWQKYGVLRTVLLMWRLRFDYWRGVSAEQLARRYD